MEGITNEIRNKIKCAVKAKLQEIGAYVDEELPDYIMVMIANRRSKSQMTSELSLFLGSHTDKFTDWLHIVLEKLEAFVGGSNATDKVKEVTSVVPKAGVEVCSLPIKVENPFPIVKQSPSRLLKANQMEAHNNATSSHNIPSNLEPKEPYVPMPVSLHSLPSVQVHRSPEGDMDDDCLNIREEIEQDFHGSDDKLLKKRNSASSANYQSSLSDPKKRRQTRSSEDRFAKKVRREERSRPRRTDGRISSQVVSVVRPMLSQIVKPVERTKLKVEKHEQEEEDEESFNNKIGINSIVRVTARRKLPAKMQATSCLILKAVAEAQKSVISHPPKVTEPETKSLPALFTRKYREKNLNPQTLAVNTTNSTVCQVSDDSAMEVDSQPSAAIVKDTDLAIMEPQETVLTKVEVPDESSYEQMESPVDSPLDIQTIETRFIVTLDGVNSLMSRCFDEDLNDDDATEMKDTERKPVKTRLFRRRSTGTEAEVQQTLERCKFYPNCRQGDRCHFHHPKTPCKNFPICLFGENCLFIHPPCKFDTTCTRKSCPYTHSQRSQVVVSVAPKIIQPSAKMHQQQPVVNGKTVCKFFPSCNNVSCLFFHPPACKYGSNCTRVGCTFFHQTNIPSANKLKWVTNAK
ncbi:zinc finger CCCH domain-containing protein 14-like [Daphnia pulicaria]|nr:zinc finger CCCH domain-containing protein 14-like [Daphnia pulicaria]